MELQQRIAMNVRKLRNEVGLSQEKLALLAGLDRTYVQDIEKGERNISVKVAEKIASALHTDIAALFNDGQKPRK